MRPLSVSMLYTRGSQVWLQKDRNFLKNYYLITTLNTLELTVNLIVQNSEKNYDEKSLFFGGKMKDYGRKEKGMVKNHMFRCQKKKGWC